MLIAASRKDEAGISVACDMINAQPDTARREFIEKLVCQLVADCKMNEFAELICKYVPDLPEVALSTLWNDYSYTFLIPNPREYTEIIRIFNNQCSVSLETLKDPFEISRFLDDNANALRSAYRMIPTYYGTTMHSAWKAAVKGDGHVMAYYCIVSPHMWRLWRATSAERGFYLKNQNSGMASLDSYVYEVTHEEESKWIIKMIKGHPTGVWVSKTGKIQMEFLDDPCKDINPPYRYWYVAEKSIPLKTKELKDLDRIFLHSPKRSDISTSKNP